MDQDSILKTPSDKTTGNELRGDDPRLEIVGLEERRWQALCTSDAGVLRDMFGDGLTWTHSSGRVDSADECLQRIQEGTVKYIEAHREGQAIAIHNKTAVVTGLARMRVAVDGIEKILTSRYTAVWSHDATRWCFVAWQSTPARDASSLPR
jgi:Domain of unknown function (DUF4440)